MFGSLIWQVVFPLHDVILFLLYDVAVYTLLAVYFDQVKPTVPGGRAEKPGFFLDPVYWGKDAVSNP